MKREIKFIDSDNILCVIEIDSELGEVLSICGEAGTDYGQVWRTIKPATKAQEDLIRYWKLYHLKASYPADELESILHELENERRNQRLGALDKYGNIDIYDKNSLDDQIDKIITVLGGKAPNKYITRDDGRRVVALLRATEYDCIDLDGIKIIDNDSIEIWGVPYYVCEWDRIKDICQQWLDRNEWVDAVTSGNTDLGYYEWRDEVIEQDGCGMLNSYDGKVSIEEVDGEEYYVIRQE